MAEPIDLRFVSSDVDAGTWLQWAPSYSSVENLVDQAIAAAEGGCIRRLVIAGHGATNGGSFVFDGGTNGVEIINGDDLTPTVRTQLQRLKPHLCNRAIIELRVCNFGTGTSGDAATNALANLLGVPVTAPRDEIKSLGVIGGLTADWLTAYPDAWDRADVSSFWVGDGERASQGEGIAPITVAVVPAPGVAPPTPIPEPLYGEPIVTADGVVAGPEVPREQAETGFARWWVALPALVVVIVLAQSLLGGG
jgi:hypothetical protein